MFCSFSIFCPHRCRFRWGFFYTLCCEEICDDFRRCSILFRIRYTWVRNNIFQREVQVIKNNLKKILNNVFCIGIICIFVYTKQINEMKITKKSSLSGVEHTLDIDITEEQFQRVEMRFFTKEKIQDILPNVSLGEREFLMTGITQEEWDNTFNYIEN